MRILTAMYTMRKGGAYDRFVMMVEALLDRGAEVHCLSLSPLPIDHPKFYLHRGICLNVEGESLLAKGLLFLFFPWVVLFIAWRQRIEVLVAFSTSYAFVYALAKSILRRPIVTFVRGEPSTLFRTNRLGCLSERILRLVSRLGLLASDRIAVTNERMRRIVLHIIGPKKQERVALLPNNIPPMKVQLLDRLEIRNRYGIREEAKLLATAGILNSAKNLEILLKALRIMKQGNIVLVVAGEGPNQKRLEQLAKDWKIETRVFFVGWISQKDLWSLFRAADLFILPSRSEGMPNVLLEALGLGLPCIGSKVPGISDILEDDELLFDPSDEKALAKRIEHILSSAQHYLDAKNRCAERAKKFVFDWNEKVYRIVTQEVF